MAAASNTGSGGQNANRSGLVYSVGLERYVNRSAQALAATRPLIEAMQRLTAVSDRLSDATGNAIRPPVALQQTTAGLVQVQSRSAGVIGTFSRMAGSASVLATRLMTAVAVVAVLARFKSLLTGEGTRAANALGFLSTATGVFAGKVSPLAGVAGAFVNVMKMLPFQLGTVGNSALAAGLGLGVMSGGIGPLSAGISLLTIGLRGIPGQMGKIVTATGSVLTMFGAASVAITALTATVGTLGVTLALLAPGLTFGVKLAAEAEQSQIAFEVMLGSAEKATQLLGEIRQYAAATPFGESDIIAASRALIAYGESADGVVSVVGRLGDVSSGLGIPLKELADIYGKARVQGRLFAQDMNQLTGRGIPMFQLLAQQFQTTEDNIKSMVDAGKVSFANLEQAFVSLTSKGGMFFGMTGRQAKSMEGLWSTFKDTVSAALREVGQKMIETGGLQRVMAATLNLLTTSTPLVRSFAVAVGGMATGLAVLTEVAAGAAKWVSDLVSGYSRLTTALKFLIPISAVTVSAILMIAAALKVMAIAQATVLALSGPAGWAALAAGVAIAGAAIYGVTEAMRKAGAEAEQAAQAVGKLNKEAAKPAEAANGNPEWQARIDKIKELIDKYKTPLDRLKDELIEIDRFAPDQSFLDSWKNSAIENATGIGATIRSLSNEIDVLTGKTTVSQQKMAEFLAMGVPADQAKEFERLSMQKAALEKSNKAREQAVERATEISQRVRETIRPMESYRSDILEAANAVREGMLSLKEFDTYAQKQSKAFAESQAKGGEGWRKNEAATTNTAAALSAVIEATSARSRGTTESLLSDLVAVTESVRDAIVDQKPLDGVQLVKTGKAF